MTSVNTASGSVMIESPYPVVRDRLLDVALQLFAEKGYEATSVREIALAANVTKPTIYYYFNSKEGLYVELANSLSESIENKLILSSVVGESTRTRIKCFLMKVIDSINDNEDNRKFILIIIKATSNSMTSKYLTLLVEMVKAKLCEIINNGTKMGDLLIKDTEYAIYSLLAYTMLCIYDSIYNDINKIDIEEIEAMLDKILDRIAL